MFSKADDGVDRKGSEICDDATEIPELNSDVLNHPISEAEVRDVLGKLKPRKAYGLDDILAQMLKLGRSKMITFLVAYFNSTFEKDYYPWDWAKAIIVSIHKKGNANLPDNYRGVSLLGVISKCCTFIMTKSLYTLLEENNKIVEEQAGFRKNYSTVGPIFALRAIVKRHLEAKMSVVFVTIVKLLTQ